MEVRTWISQLSLSVCLRVFTLFIIHVSGGIRFKKVNFDQQLEADVGFKPNEGVKLLLLPKGFMNILNVRQTT